VNLQIYIPLEVPPLFKAGPAFVDPFMEPVPELFILLPDMLPFFIAVFFGIVVFFFFIATAVMALDDTCEMVLTDTGKA
jgi:hypothetical protein